MIAEEVLPQKPDYSDATQWHVRNRDGAAE